MNRLPIAGNPTTYAIRDDNGMVVSACCEAELKIHPAVERVGRDLDLAPGFITWVCSHCNATVTNVETERAASPHQKRGGEKAE